jgi:hypothetical protein
VDAVDSFPVTEDGTERDADIHPAIALAFKALEESGLPWLLLRGSDDLLRPAGDVDILVDRKLLPRLDALMESAGFRRVLAGGRGSHRFYFRYSIEDRHWLKLDVVADIDFGKYQQCHTPLGPGCLRRRVRSGPVWVPEHLDQAWLHLLHLVLDKDGIPASRQRLARSLADAAADGGPIGLYIDQQMGAGTSARLIAAVKSGEWDRIPALGNRMRRGKPATLLPQLWSATLNRGERRLGARLKGRAPVLGVMAPDGAGKTSLLHGLRDDIPLPTKYVYMGLWGSGPFDAWLKAVPGGVSLKMLFRLTRGGLLARFYSIMGKVVLMDRVAYDVLLPGTDQGRLSSVTNTLAMKVIPDPDMLLVLDVPGDVMFLRKGEHSPEVLESLRDAYRQLAARLPRSTILDAAQPQDVVQREATEVLWRNLAPATGTGPEAGCPAEGGPSDVLSLHLWRLLDWRFLLPNLEPGRVAFGGEVSREKEAALRLLDPSAVRLSIPAAAEADHTAQDRANTEKGTADVVLLSVPDRDLFARAEAALVPGGWVCIEAQRSMLQGTGPRTLSGWRQTLLKNGFEDVQVYWNVPSLERTSRMVPVVSRAGIRDTLALRRDVRFGALKAAAARFALAANLFGVAAPAGTVTGRKPEQGNRR